MEGGGGGEREGGGLEGGGGGGVRKPLGFGSVGRVYPCWAFSL